MQKITKNGDLKHLRRLALSAQGLLQSKPFGQGKPGTLKAINHIGYVQLDTISVVERAHHHVLYSRVPGFDPVMANQLLVKGEIFEYWSHAAAFLPMQDYRFSLPYKLAIGAGKVHWYKDADTKLMSSLLDRIKQEGPLRARDVESTAKKHQGWWDWKPAKKALEQLYMQGDLMVCDRQGFKKTYDLTERVLPDSVDRTPPTVDEFAKHLLEQHIRCHKVFTLKGVTYLRRNEKLRKAVKQLVDDYLDESILTLIELPSGEQLLAETLALHSRTPKATDRLSFLSPFDNCLIQRDRLANLFQFDYQLECYLPASKRQFGYFSLPLLYRDELVGRMDCKAHRREKRLEIKSLHVQTQSEEEGDVFQAIAKALPAFCIFQQCDHATVGKQVSRQLNQLLNDGI